MKLIKESVKAVLENKEHYNLVAIFAQTAFHKYCNENPTHIDVWREYENFQVFDSEYIRINYHSGLVCDNIRHSDCIFIDLNTNKISDTYEKNENS